MSPNLIILRGSTSSAVARSLQEPNALVAQVDYSVLARRGVAVKVPRSVFLFIVAVTAHPGVVVQMSELGEMLFGDRADGGPQDVVDAIGRAAFTALPALMALGYRLETHRGRGRSVRCCLAATPLTYGDLAHDREQIHAQA